MGYDKLNLICYFASQLEFKLFICTVILNKKLFLMNNNSDFRKIITIDPNKRGGRPCIRNMRISVYDVLSYLASGMDANEILDDFPELTIEDINACLKFASEREYRSIYLVS